MIYVFCRQKRPEHTFIHIYIYIYTFRCCPTGTYIHRSTYIVVHVSMLPLSLSLSLKYLVLEEARFSPPLLTEMVSSPDDSRTIFTSARTTHSCESIGLVPETVSIMNDLVVDNTRRFILRDLARGEDLWRSVAAADRAARLRLDASFGPRCFIIISLWRIHSLAAGPTFLFVILWRACPLLGEKPPSRRGENVPHGVISRGVVPARSQPKRAQSQGYSHALLLLRKLKICVFLRQTHHPIVRHTQRSPTMMDVKQSKNTYFAQLAHPRHDEEKPSTNSFVVTITSIQVFDDGR